MLLGLCRNTKRRPGSDRQNRTITTIEIPTCREAVFVLFTMGYAHAHVPSMADTCTELA